MIDFVCGNFWAGVGVTTIGKARIRMSRHSKNVGRRPKPMTMSLRSKQPALETAFSGSVLLVTAILLAVQPVGATEHAGSSFSLADRPLFVFEQPETVADDSTVQSTQPFNSNDKLHLAWKRIRSLRRIAGTAGTAGLSQITDSSLQRGYGKGFDDYLKRFGSHTAFWASKDLVGTFALASLLDHDPRYRPLAHGGFWKRVGHAVASSFVIRSRRGGRTMNLSNLGGLAAASGLSNFWHADEDRGAKEALARFGLGLAADALVRLVVELSGSFGEHDKNERSR